MKGKTKKNGLVMLSMVDLLASFSDLERLLNLNLGQEEEFSPLQGQCYEYTDRE